jgi:hypothetical protein
MPGTIADAATSAAKTAIRPRSVAFQRRRAREAAPLRAVSVWLMEVLSGMYK